MMASSIFLLVSMVLAAWIQTSDAHGRLIDPASRGSAFRFGFKNPADWNDNAGVCGGHSNQKSHGGKCGVCGDPPQGPFPHEAGGTFANGIITKEYKKGEKIHVSVDLTANHGGWFEFQICGPLKDKLTKVTDGCLQKLQILEADGKAVGATRFTMPEKRKGKWNFSVQLPASLTCDHCVFRWFWYPSKDWGCDADGTCGTGHGPQEKHIHCADVAIH